MDVQAYWDRIYTEKAPNRVSWYRPHLEASLAQIERSCAAPSASIIDVGGGDSTLLDYLLGRGYSNLTVLVSAASPRRFLLVAIAACERVHWMVADITQTELKASAYDVWHDRAVLHFLTSAVDRKAYVHQVVRSVKRGGHVIISAFGLEGPTRCSGLDVIRYDADSLHAEFGANFRLVSSSQQVHEPPFGTTQQFLYCHCVLQ